MISISRILTCRASRESVRTLFRPATATATATTTSVWQNHVGSPIPIGRFSPVVASDVDRSFVRRELSSTSSSLPDSPPPSSSSSTSTIRLSKLISQYASNLAISRREVERFIRQGEVTFAGNVITKPHHLVEWDDVLGKRNKALAGTIDTTKLSTRSSPPVIIKIGGKPVHILPPNEHSSEISNNNNNNDDISTTKVWIANKLPGEVVTERDPLNRPSLIDRLIRSGVGKFTFDGGNKKRLIKQQNQRHIKPIGRLDVPTEGLILLTNDGEYARNMELPSSKIHRTYRARVHGKLTPAKLSRIRSGGVQHEGIRYGPMKVIFENQKLFGNSRASTKARTSTNTWLRVTTTEGKNRQVRNVFTALGLTVTRLVRISYGDYELKTMRPGMVMEVQCKPVETQRNKGPLQKQTMEKRASRDVDGEAGSASPVQWVTYKRNF